MEYTQIFVNEITGEREVQWTAIRIKYKIDFEKIGWERDRQLRG